MAILSHSRLQELLSKFADLKPILVVGDVGLDKYTHGEVLRISPEAPVPILNVSKEWYKLGLAANVADNLKSLGVASTVCAVVGEDPRGVLLENLLEERGLRTWGIVRSADRTTTFKERVTTKSQQICRIDYESSTLITADCEAKLLDRAKDFVKDHSAVILEDYSKGVFTEALTPRLIELFREQKKFIAVDPGRQTHPLLYKGATLMKPNLSEARLMAQMLGKKEKDVESLGELLREKLELKMLVITMGSEGMAIWDQNQSMKMIPTVETEVFDVSGAGDTAVSTITAALTAGATLEEAAWMGNAASGVVVAKKGTALVTVEELGQFHKRMVQKLEA